MTKALLKLLEIGGAAFAPPNSAWPDKSNIFKILNDKMLSRKNGFFAFESALRVFPNVTTEQSWGIGEWNSSSLWKNEYGGIADNVLCFAEDIFGGQFCLAERGVSRFDPESGAFDPVADDLESWAAKLLLNYGGMTGYGTAHAWQARNGPLPPRSRLMPKRPFVVGGTSEQANFVAIDSVRLMKNMGNLARQIHDLPNGSQIKFKIVH